MPELGTSGSVRGALSNGRPYRDNCPQHIVERYTLEDVRTMTAPLTARIAELEAQLDRQIGAAILNLDPSRE